MNYAAYKVVSPFYDAKIIVEKGLRQRKSEFGAVICSLAVDMMFSRHHVLYLPTTLAYETLLSLPALKKSQRLRASVAHPINFGVSHIELVEERVE